jgi:hypothetical protein
MALGLKGEEQIINVIEKDLCAVSKGRGVKVVRLSRSMFIAAEE